eukprot:Em0011g796a
MLHIGSDLLTERLCCVGVVCQSQRIQRLPKRTLRHLLKFPAVVTVLADVCGKVCLSQLVLCLMTSLLGDLLTGSEGAMGMTEQMLNEVQLDEEIVQKLIKQLFDYYLEKVNGDGMEDKTRQTIASLAQSLNTKYPRVVDTALQSAVSQATSCTGPQAVDGRSKEKGRLRLELLHQFVAFTLPQSSQQVLPELQSTLALSINHPDPGVRSLAVRHLVTSIQQKSTYDLEFTSSSLAARLEDDCPDVVLAVLELGPTTLLQCMKGESLVTSLIKVVGRRPSKGWEVCVLSAVKVLSSLPLLEVMPTRVEDVLMALLPLLHPDYHGNQLAMGVARTLLESPLGKTHPLLGGLVSCVSSEVRAKGVCCCWEWRLEPVLLGVEVGACTVGSGGSMYCWEWRLEPALLGVEVGACTVGSGGWSLYRWEWRLEPALLGVEVGACTVGSGGWSLYRWEWRLEPALLGVEVGACTVGSGGWSLYCWEWRLEPVPLGVEVGACTVGSGGWSLHCWEWRWEPVLLGVEVGACTVGSGGWSLYCWSGVWKEGCSSDARKDPHLLGQACATMVYCLGQQLSRMEDTRAESLVTKLFAAVSSTAPLDSKASCVYLSLLGVAVATMSGEASLRIAQFVLEHIYTTWLATLESVDSTEEQWSPFELSSAFSFLVQKRPPWPTVRSFMLVWLLRTIIDSVGIPGNMENAMWLTVADIKDHYYGFLLATFTTLIVCVERFKGQMMQGVCRSLFQHFIQRHLSGRGSLLRFLAMIWTAPPSGGPGEEERVLRSHIINARTQIHSLNMAVAYLRSSSTSQVLTLAVSSCPVVPSLLVCLVGPFKEVREAAMQCLVLIHEATAQLTQEELHQCRANTPFLHLVDVLVGSSLAVCADPASLVQLVTKLLVIPIAMETERPKVEQTPSKGRRAKKPRAEPEMTSSQGANDSILASLLSHIVDLDAPTYVQLALLKVLQGVESETKLNGLLPLLSKLTNRVLQQPPATVTMATNAVLNMYEGLTLQMLVECYTPSTASLLRVNEEPFELFLKLLGCASLSATNTTPPQDLALKQLTREFFIKMETASLQSLLYHLVELMLDSQRSKVITMVKEAMAQVPLTTKLVIHFLELYEQQLKPPPTPSKKPRLRNAKSQPTAVEWKEDASRAWRRLTALLEFIQHRCASIGDCHLLVPYLFNVLSRNLEEEESKRVSLEYTVQLVLSSLLNLCNYLQSQSNVRGGLLLGFVVLRFIAGDPVQCGTGGAVCPGLEQSPDPQPRPPASGSAATVFPVMSGNSSLLPDHTHKTPSSKRASPSATTEDVVTEIVRVFVDATPHIPAHRRLPLLSHLVSTLDPHQYLHTTLGLLCTKHVGQSTLVEQTPKEAVIEVSFVLSLAQEFSALVQSTSILRLLGYVAELPEEKPSGTLCMPFWVVSLDREGHIVMENVVLQLLQCLLKYISVLNKARSNCHSSSAKFWESLLRKSYDIIDKVVSLLSVGSFLQIGCQLLSETRGDVQRKSLDMFTAKIEKGEVKLTVEHDPGLLSVVDILLQLLGDASVLSITRQSSLYALKVLAQRLGARHKDQFTQVCRAVLSLLRGEDIGDQIYASGLLCVAELMRALGPHLIPSLPQLMACVLKYTGNIQEGRELLHLSAVTTLSVYVKMLPKFLSPYMAEMIEKLCAPSLLNADKKEKIQVRDEASSVRELVAKNVPARTLLPAYQKTYSQLVVRSKESTVALLSMFRSTIASLSKEDVKGHNQALVDIVMMTLDYRANHSKEPIEEVLPVENVCLEGFTELMVKLSEASFRPLFHKLLDWATSPSAPRDRIITFYHLADTVAGKLKSLFLLFAGHILKNATFVLDKNNLEVGGPDQLMFHGGEDGDDDEKAPKGCCLLNYVIGTLHKCFLYDRSSFVTKERFEILLLPLVNQISNQLGGSKHYQERVESCIVACVAQLAVAAGKDTLWKSLNYQVLLKTRHSDVSVRFAALKVLQEMYTKLGEEFLVLLPEIIPFLSELMEDESVEVEQQTQVVISVIEGIMGESIQQFF